MSEKHGLEQLNRIPVAEAVVRNAIPAMIAMLMVLVYNLADTFFIGQTNDDLQVAAVSLATPVFLIFMSVGTVFGVGGTSVIARAMGEGRKEYAGKVCAFCMWGCIGIGLLLTVIFLCFMEQILSFIGASGDTWELTRTYLMIVTYSGPFVLIAGCFSNILRAEGEAVKAMTGQLLGNILNIILDPILILGLGWDVAGAAIATVIGNLVAAGYYLLYFASGKSSLSIHIRDAAVKGSICSDVLSIGIPASLGSLLMSLSQIIMNSQMAQYGDMALAGIGVAMKVTMLTGMLCMGLGQGVQPLLGYCIGAKNWLRYKKIMRFSMCLSFALGVVATGVCYLLLEPIVKAFLTDANALEYGMQFSKILLTTGALFGIFYMLLNALQAMGAAKASLIINLSRQGLIYIPMLFIMDAAIGMTGLVWAQPVADALSLLLAVVLYRLTYDSMMHEKKGKLRLLTA